MTLALLGAGILVLAVTAYAMRKRHPFEYYSSVMPRSALESLEGDGWNLQSRKASDGIALDGLVRQAASGEKRWILFLPGNSGGLLEGHKGALETLFRGQGMGLSMWAYRGFDASQGTPSPALLDSDAHEAFSDLQKSHGVSASEIHLVGYSLGACIASRLAATLSEEGTPAASLSLIAYSDLITIQKPGLLGQWREGDLYDSVGIASKIPAPVLLLHGTADIALPLEEAQGIRSALGERAKRVDLPGAGHTTILEDQRAIKALLAFLGS